MDKKTDRLRLVVNRPPALHAADLKPADDYTRALNVLGLTENPLAMEGQANFEGDLEIKTASQKAKEAVKALFGE